MISNYKETEMMVYKSAVQLEKLIEDYPVPSSKKLYEEINEIEQRLIEKKFRVAVVGEFNRGKSSLINVLLGKRILPEDVLATTATINRITYGEHPRAYLVMKDNDTKTEDISVEDLASYVTKLTESSAQKAAEISEAVVEYPTMLCFNDVDLIDTPGMNDMDDMNAVTVNRLENIDLAIVAVSALLPFSETERNFVVQLLESSNICQIIFVITHIDGVRLRERERLIDYIKNRICTTVLEELEKNYQSEENIFLKYSSIFDDLKIYAVSSWDGMDALETNDMELYEKSGYLELTKDLPDIILNSRSSQMIRNIIGRILTIIGEYSDKLGSQQLMYDGWEKKIEEIFSKNDFKQNVEQCDRIIQEGNDRIDVRQPEPQSADLKMGEIYADIGICSGLLTKISEIRRKIMCEENTIAHRLLLSLNTVRTMTSDAVREAILPAMQAEFSRINQLYRESQIEINEHVVLNLRQELQKNFSGIEQILTEDPAFYSMEADVINELHNTLDELKFSGDMCLEDEFYFHWTQSPIEIVMNTPAGQSVLPGLACVAGDSLAEGNKQLNQKIRCFYDEMADRALALADRLKNEMLTRIHTLKGHETQNEGVLAKLEEIKNLCQRLYEG